MNNWDASGWGAVLGQARFDDPAVTGSCGPYDGMTEDGARRNVEFWAGQAASEAAAKAVEAERLAETRARREAEQLAANAKRKEKEVTELAERVKREEIERVERELWATNYEAERAIEREEREAEIAAREAQDADFCALGSGLVDQSQKMTVAARAMAERKTVGHRS